MINISEANKAKWNTSAGFKTLTIEFPDDDLIITNNDILSDSLELEESINSDHFLTFTGCIASRLSFEIADIVQDLRGHRVTAKIRIDSETAIPLFYGYIDSQDNLSHQDVVTRFEAYDPMVSRVNNVDLTEWYNSLTFPRSVRSFRNALFSQLGLTQRSVVLTNDYLTIAEKTITDETITGGQLLKYICQLNGVFGQFDREGRFKYVTFAPFLPGLYPDVDLFPSPDLYPARENAAVDTSSLYNRIQYEPFMTDAIEAVKIITSDGTLGGSAGTGSNTLTISDNPLAWAVDMDQAAENILVNVSDISFTPAEIGVIGLPYIECGDITFANTQKNIVRSYVLERHLSGIQAITDEFNSSSDKSLPIYKESTKTAVSRNSDEIDRTNEHVDEAIEETRDYVDDSIEEEATRVNTLIADKIEAEEIRTNTLVANSIEASEIRTERLIASSIQAEEIRTNNLVAQKIQAEETRTNTLVANSIQAEATRTNTLVANSIQAEATRTNTLVANSIQAEETRTNTLVANSIQAEATRTNTLIAQKIQAEETRTNQLLAEKASIDYVNGNFADFNYLNANYLSAQSIQASYATLGDLSATNATISQLNTEIVNTNQVVAQKANITDLNAVSARVGTLEANSITTSYLYANDITVKSLYAWGGNVQGSALIGSVVSCDSIGMGGYTATWQSKTINGVTINYLGR